MVSIVIHGGRGYHKALYGGTFSRMRILCIALALPAGFGLATAAVMLWFKIKMPKGNGRCPTCGNKIIKGGR